MNELKVLHMYPDILDLYGDSGNIEILKYHCKNNQIQLLWDRYGIGDSDVDFSAYDIIFMGGGADFEQSVISDDLMKRKEQIVKAYESGVYFFAICGGYQLLGKYYIDANGNKIDGLGLFEYYTQASKKKNTRCIGNIVVQTVIDGEEYMVIGYENHGGQTMNVKQPLGTVLLGEGNCFGGGIEGYVEENVLASYLHGPFLSKNPKLAYRMINYAMTRKLGKEFHIEMPEDSLVDDCRKHLLERFLEKS